MTLTSSAFSGNGAIPKHFTCDGKDISPPLTWAGSPSGTRSFALILDDLDAQDFTHWIVFNLPANARSLSEGVSAKALSPNTKEGSNDFGAIGYGGPCPPSGVHHYRFRIYALDTASIDAQAPAREAFEPLMKSHVLATGTLVGTYQR